MQPVDDDEGESTDNATNCDTDDPKFLFFDYETIQETGTHVPNLVIVQNQDGDENLFKGEKEEGEGERKQGILFNYIIFYSHLFF
jgi:hypothetical protein